MFLCWSLNIDEDMLSCRSSPVDFSAVVVAATPVKGVNILACINAIALTSLQEILQKDAVRNFCCRRTFM